MSLPADKAPGDVIRSSDYDQILAALRLIATAVVVKTGNYDVTTSDMAVLADATLGNMNLNLPAVTAAGKLFLLAKTDVSGNYVSITPAGSDKIDGLAVKFLVSQYDKLLLMADGVSNWVIVSVVGTPH